MLEVRLLGQFDVQRDSIRLVLPSRHAQSLFAYLVLTAGTSHRREKLAGLFWPDSTEENARRNLRQELWRVRKVVEPRGPGLPTLPYLLVDEIHLTFNPRSEYWLDVAALGQPNLVHASVQELIDEVALYRGELLPGFYEEWVLVERERVRALFEQKINRLLVLLVEEKRWDAVLEWGERWIHLERSPEPAFRALMTAYCALGDRSRMATVFERCTLALREDLNVEPSPQTRALFRQLSKEDALPRSETVVPPVPTPQKRATNLPVPLSSFIGRERECNEVRQLLSTTRLLTLTGAGGVGKTRLAIQAAGELEIFSGGITWVDFAALADGRLVAQEVANSLGVHEAPPEPLEGTLANHLRTGHLVLVLDNCEHLIHACAQLAERLLSACPHLKILATSREPLGIMGETVWRVPSLTLPPPGARTPEELGSSEAVRLFIDRARAVRPRFEMTEENALAVTEICRRLDGIPLAIELAAARLKVLSTEEIAARLDDRFHLLTLGSRTALPRHQTLHALIDWSYDLLTAPERAVFRRLSVFAGGFSLEAAEAVCGADYPTGENVRSADVLDLLAQLIAKSLVVVEPREPRLRYRMLETIRQYAHDRLVEARETDPAGRVHLDYYLGLAEKAEPEIRGSNQTAWLDRLEDEHDNLGTALHRAIETGNAEAALRLACASTAFWEVRGYFVEARERLGAVLRVPDEGKPRLALLRARALSDAGYMGFIQSDFAKARSLGDEAMAISKELGDKEGLATALSILFLAAWAQGDYVSAREKIEQSLAIRRELGDRRAIALALKSLGLAVRELGDYAKARALMEESLSQLRELGEPWVIIGKCLMDNGATASAQGDPAASTLLEEALAIFEKLGDKLDVARCMHDLAAIAARQGDVSAARSRFATGLAFFRDLGDTRNLIKCLEGLGGVCAAEGNAQKAARLYGASEALRQALGTPLPTSYRADYERNLSTLRTQLDESSLSAAWAEGRALTMQQAAIYALAETRDH